MSSECCSILKPLFLYSILQEITEIISWYYYYYFNQKKFLIKNIYPIYKEFNSLSQV